MIMRKTLLVIATIFLATAIIVPSAIFAYNYNLNSSNIRVSNPNGQVTGGNTTLAQGFKPPQGINSIVPVVIGIIFFALFAIFAFVGLKRSKNSPPPLLDG
jgi:hypothetical protein